MDDIGIHTHVEMNVQECCSYKKFQKKLGVLLLMPRQGRAIPKYAHNIPMLDSDDFNFVTSSLRFDNDCAVGFAIRKRDGWIPGFRNKNGQWFKFADTLNPNLIPNSIRLNICGNYKDLGARCHTNFKEVKINPSMMSDYVRTLGNFDVVEEGDGELIGIVGGDVAKALMACIIFTAEGCCFRFIAENIQYKMCHVRDNGSFMLETCVFGDDLERIAMGYDVAKLITNWSKLSKALLYPKQNDLLHLALAVVNLILYEDPDN